MNLGDLRIGSYVKLESVDDIFWIQSLFLKDGEYFAEILPRFSSGSELMTIKLREILPIKISVDNLGILGFIMDGPLFTKDSSEYRCEVKMGFMEPWDIWTISFYNRSKKWNNFNRKYIHEVQNLLLEHKHHYEKN